MMKVFFATNRKVENDSDLEHQRPKFSNKFSDCIRVGRANVKICSGQMKAGEKVNHNARCKSVQCADKGIDHIFEKLTDEVKNTNRDTNTQVSVLVYIHGFRNSFEESVERAAKLAYIYSSKKHRFVPFVLSWPSNFGKNRRGYDKARENAEKSGRAAARIYDRFVALAQEKFISNDQDIHEPCARMFLVAHSMGVYMLRHLVQKVERKDTSLFDTAILVAANEHRDALGCEKELLPLANLARQVAVYCYSDDSTLNLGYFTGAFEFKDCLGLHGPSPQAFQRFQGELSTIKCRDVIPSDFGSKHGYHHRLPNVVYDIRQVLKGASCDDIKYRRPVRGGIWEKGERVYLLQPFHRGWRQG